MKRRRIWAFISHLCFWLPLSLVINMFALMPVFMLTDIDVGMNIFFYWLISWALAFFLSKLRLRIKGKQTDFYYDAAYDEVTKYYYRDVQIGESHHEIIKTESANTGWGWLGIILSFILFPLQIVATIAAFLGMFYPRIYSTTKKLPDNRYFSLGNNVLHILFDFVIISVPAQIHN